MSQDPNAALELERLKTSIEISRIENRSKVRQVVFGTMIVGLAAAAFPFMQKLAEVASQQRIEEIKSRAQIEVLDRQNELSEKLAILENDLATERQQSQEELDRRAFLNSLAAEARSEQIEKRIILAEFFSFLAEGEERQQWEGFRDYLQEQQKEFVAQIETLSGGEAADDYRLGQIQRSIDPKSGESVPALPLCNVLLLGPPGQVTLREGVAMEAQNCINPEGKPADLMEFIILHSTGSPAQSDPSAMASLLSQGRVDLPGPLAHFVIFRDGTLVQTAGLGARANHVGQAAFEGRPLTNAMAIGIEFDSQGAEDYTPAQLEVARLLVQRLMAELQIPIGHVLGHADVALPRGRKSDPSGFPWAEFRAGLSQASASAP